MRNFIQKIVYTKVILLKTIIKWDYNIINIQIEKYFKRMYIKYFFKYCLIISVLK